MANNRFFLRVIFLFLCFFFHTTHFSQGTGLYVELFTPTGAAKQVKQIQVRFSEPIVSIGDPRPKSDIFKIDCPFPGTGRWIDSSTWVYEFEKEMPGGAVCKFVASPDIKSLKGNMLNGETKFQFDTGGPSIVYSSPYSGNTIDEDQIFILHLDAKPDISTVKKFAYFSVTELSNRIPVEVIEGKERKSILKANESEDNESVVLIRSRQTFLPDKNVQLVWGQGIRASLGGEIAEDQIYNYSVRSPFSVSFSCDRVNAKANCIPILPMRLYFTSSVSTKDLKYITLKSKDGKEFKSNLQTETLGEDSSHYVDFPGPFPENSEFTIEIPNSIEDEMGRKLVNIGTFPLTVKTADFPPLAKFAAKFGILEANANPAIPVTLRNLEAQIPMIKADLGVSSSAKRTLDPLEIQKWFIALSKHQREKSIFDGSITGITPEKTILPKPNGKKPMEVVGIPLEKPGFYVVELASDVLGSSLLEKKGKMYVASSALVTNLAVHFKWGSDSSLVWVTTLDKAIPESGVIIKIIDCKGTVRATGVTGKDGILKLGKFAKGDIPYCGYYEMGSGLTVFAEKNGDVSFTSSTWDQGIESWRFNLPSYSYSDASDIQAIVLDRTLFRAGETAHLKHFRRGHSIQGLIASDPKFYPKKVMIQHDGSGEKFSFPLVWSFPGTSESEFVIPKNARLGTYRVYYPASEEDDSYGNTIATFKVEEFRLPALKGGIQLVDNQTYLVSPKKAKVDLNLQYLSGGGAGSMPVLIRGMISQRPYNPNEDDAAFSFHPEEIVPGKVLVSGYSEEDPVEEEQNGNHKIFKAEKLTLDEKGFGNFTFKDIKEIKADSALEVEMEYNDPNGEIQTVYRSFPVYRAGIHLGIQTKGWMFSKEKVEMQVIALDLKNAPKKNQKVKVKAYSQVFYSNRKRLVGGFYAYEHYKEVKDLGVYCEGKTNDKGILDCDRPSPSSGEILFSATTEDDNGNTTNSTYSVYVASSEDTWFEATDHNRMDVIPEKKYTEIGDNLKLQLKSPFRDATALITVEREGVIDSFVFNVTGSNPFVTIPIKKEYAPNVYLSALLIRGRVGEPKATALVDLGRPSFRMGLAPIRVGWKPFELKVSVKPNKDKFKTRETVNSTITVLDSSGKPPKAGGEVLVAVVDEALLELSPNPTWKLLDSMMGLRGLDVGTSTGQSQIIGRRHFGLKARPTGGGGGKSPTRNLFNTLVYWKGKILLDKDGKATVSFPLNDSLTSFKIVAVANSGTNEFGTGSATIQSTQEIQTFSGLTSVAREGDLLDHEFTIRNASSESKSLSVRLKSSETARSNPKLKTPAFVVGEKKVELKPNSTNPIFWNLQVPEDTMARTFTLDVLDTAGNVIDSILVEQKVSPVVKESVYMAGLVQIEGKFEERVQAPNDSVGKEAKLKVSVAPSIMGNLKSVDSYFQNYPYNCMEQRVSTAIGLRSTSRWKQIESELGGYLDENGFVKYFPKMESGSEILTAYVLTSAKLAGFALSGEFTTKMTDSLRGYLAGTIRGDRWTFGADTIVRKIIVTEALSRYETLTWDSVSPLLRNMELLPTASIIDLLEISNRVTSADEKSKSRLTSILRSRLNLQGTELVIADKNFTSPWWILGSTDYTMSRLTLWALADPSYKKDLPRIVKGLLKKQRNGRWDTTLGNAYGVLAMERAAKILESEKVSGGVVTLTDAGKETILDPNKPDANTNTVRVGESPKDITMVYNGKGKPWLSWEVRSRIPLTKPLNSGYTLKRTVTPIVRANSGIWTKGDVIKVRLEIQADSDKTWVVVEDAIPSGSIHMGRGLGKESKILQGSIIQQDFESPTFEEKSFSHYRAYFEYLPQGNHVIEYTIQLNHPGSFSMPGARVEAMYSPEVFGELPLEKIKISGAEN
ncbi:MAG: MG2 domain-containing protein [Leptospira sp.]|nr:MG2 domain-containing protein [Leptospira sp.]